jgi:hypothetical protein
MKFTRHFYFLIAIISCVFIFTGCFSAMLNSGQKNREFFSKKAIREVEDDRFLNILPTLTVEITSQCPIGFGDYLKEDFRKNISRTNGKPSGSVLMMVEYFEMPNDSISVKLTMFVFKADSTFVKGYSGASTVTLKQYGKSNAAIDPMYKEAYAQIRAAFKKDASYIASMLLKN